MKLFRSFLLLLSFFLLYDVIHQEAISGSSPPGGVRRLKAANLFANPNFDGGVTATNTTVTPYRAKSPTGRFEAATIMETTTNAAHNARIGYTASITATPYVYTTWIKNFSGTREAFSRVFDNSGSHSASMRIDPTTGRITSAATCAGSFTACSGTVQYLGDGWYETKLYFTATTATRLDGFVQFTQAGGTSSYAGDTTMGFYIAGFDLRAPGP